MKVNVDHTMVLNVKLGEEEYALPVPDPIYVPAVGETIVLNIMRPEKENKFEIVKCEVKEIEHVVVDFSEGEQLVRIKLEKIE